MKSTFLLMLVAFCGVSKIGLADCSISTNCGTCNSGSFTATCKYVDGNNFTCTGCTGNGCPGSPGCCCGHTINAPVINSCSSASCGGSPTCSAKNNLPGVRSEKLLASLSPGSIGELFHRFSQVRVVGNQDIPGMIVTRGAPIEIETAADTNLEISEFKLDITPNQINGASFTIKNLGTSDLVAYSLVVNTYWDSAPTIPMPLRVSTDGWFMKQYVLHPGDSRPGAVTTGISPNTQMRLLRVTVIPDYAEFADGTVAGGSASVLTRKLAASRCSKEKVRQAYVSMLKSGKDVASIIAVLKSENPQVTIDDPSSRLALSMLRTVATRQGEAAFLKVLEDEPPVAERTPVNK